MKKTITKIIILALIGLSNVTNGQAPSWDWTKSAGGTGNENGYGTAADALGNVYVTGNYTSPTITFGTTTLTNAGNSDIFLVKYDASGNILWAKGAGGTGNDFSNSIATDTSGNVYVSGGYASPSITIGADTLTNAGSTDIMVIKYDALGNILWAKGAGGTGTDNNQSIATDASGDVYITGGYASPTITFGATIINNAGGSSSSDVFIVKYDASGNVLWAKGAGRGTSDGGQGITTDASGNLYVTGYFDYPSIIFGTTTIQNSGGLGVLYDMFLVKYDVSGNVLWAKGAGSGGDERGRSTATDGSGNVYVTGSFNGSIGFGSGVNLSTAGGLDMFIAKYDSSGTLLWARRAGGSVDDYSRSTTTDASGNVYVTGYYNSPSITFGATTLINADGWGGTNDMFLVKYNASGNVLWAMAVGGRSNEYGNSTTIDASGNFYVTGTYNTASITFGATTLANVGGSDMFIAKLGITTGIENNTLTNELSVYPNPTTGLLLLSNNYNVTLTDMTGKIITNEQNTNAIDISNQPAGMYFLLLTDNKGKIVQHSKVLKE